MPRRFGAVGLVAMTVVAGCADKEQPAVVAVAPTTAPSAATQSAAAQEVKAVSSDVKTDVKSEQTEKVVKSEEEWRKELTPEQYHVLREKGTERPFTGKYWNVKEDGTYVCAACGQELFKSDTKFDSGCGWPSFYDAIDQGKIKTHDDFSHGMHRIEVTCSRCGGHLGHVFEDGPNPTGLRYCINSASIDLKKGESKKP